MRVAFFWGPMHLSLDAKYHMGTYDLPAPPQSDHSVVLPVYPSRKGTHHYRVLSTTWYPEGGGRDGIEFDVVCRVAHR